MKHGTRIGSAAGRKALSVLLAVIFAFSCMPTSALAYAADIGGAIAEATTVESDTATASVSSDDGNDSYLSAAADDDIASGTSGDVSWTIDADGVLNFYPTDGSSGMLDFYDSYSDVPWYPYRTEVTAVTFEEGIEVGGTLDYFFYGMSNATSIDVSNFRSSSSLVSLVQTFYDCSSLTSLDLYYFDTANVTSLYETFYGCSSLTSLNLGGSFSTDQVTSFYGTFRYCSSLTTLDLSGLSTASARTLEYMFQGCTSLTTLDVKYLRTWNATSLDYMFQGCTSLTTLSGTMLFDTSSVTSLNYTFQDCTSLTTLDLSTWNTSNVTSLDYTFQGCTSLTTLDLTEWDMSNVTSRTCTFDGCSSLSSVTFGEYWDWTYGSSKSLTASDVSTGTLPTPPTPTTTGKWILEEEEEDDLTLEDEDLESMTAAELAAAWEGNESEYAGTWVWEYPSTYTVTFDSNAGDDAVSGSMDTLEWEVDGSYTFPECSYSRSGYDFVGWSLTSDGSDTLYYAGDTVPSDFAEAGDEIVLYAIWTSVGFGYLTISKEFDSSGSTVEDLVFTFLVTYGDGTTETVELTSDDGWTWTSDELAEGTTYTVAETDIPDGYSLVSIDGASGTIETGVTSTVTVSNTYSAYGTWSLSAEKVLQGADVSDYAFSFLLVEELSDGTSEVVSRVQNDEDGSIAFQTVGYTADDVGSHVYYVYEVDDGQSGIVYDDTVYTVTVVVSDDGDGTLSTTVSYDADGAAADSISFVNQYATTTSLPVAGGDGIPWWLAAGFAALAASAVAVMRRRRNGDESGYTGAHLK